MDDREYEHENEGILAIRLPLTGQKAEDKEMEQRRRASECHHFLKHTEAAGKAGSRKLKVNTASHRPIRRR